MFFPKIFTRSYFRAPDYYAFQKLANAKVDTDFGKFDIEDLVKASRVISKTAGGIFSYNQIAQIALSGSGSQYVADSVMELLQSFRKMPPLQVLDLELAPHTTGLLHTTLTEIYRNLQWTTTLEIGEQIEILNSQMPWAFGVSTYEKIQEVLTQEYYYFPGTVEELRKTLSNSEEFAMLSHYKFMARTLSGQTYSKAALIAKLYFFQSLPGSKPFESEKLQKCVTFLTEELAEENQLRR